MQFNNSLLVGTLLAVFLDPAAATAVPLTFMYEGLIDYTIVPPAYESAFNAFQGETIRVEYTFESTTPDSDPSVALGEYDDAVTAMTITLGAVVYSASYGNIIVEYGGGGLDVYTVVNFGVFSGLTGPIIGGLFPAKFSISLQGTFLSSDALPTVQPDPSAFGVSRGMGFFFVDLAYGYPEWWEKDIVQLASQNPYVVPEPGTASLLATGIAALAIRGRRLRVGDSNRGWSESAGTRIAPGTPLGSVRQWGRRERAASQGHAVGAGACSDARVLLEVDNRTARGDGGR